MKKVDESHLNQLIDSLLEYKKQGVVDPWVFDCGHVIEPLDVLLELRHLRRMMALNAESKDRPSRPPIQPVGED